MGDEADEQAFWGGRVTPIEVTSPEPIWTHDFLVSALADSRIGTWQVDMRTGLVTWDAETSRIFGLEPVPVRVGRDLPVHPDDQQHLWALLEECHRARAPYDLVFRGLHADGTVRWLRGKGGSYPRDAAESHCMAGTVCDVTDKIETERSLTDREARITKMFEQAAVGIMEAKPDGTIRVVNSRFCEILGRSEDEIRATTFADYTHPDDLEWNLALRDKQFEAAEPFQVQKRYIRPNGEIVWCEVSVSFLTSDDGRVEGTITVAKDITAEKSAAAALQDSTILNQSVLDASSDCIKIIGHSGEILFMNRPGAEAFELDSPTQVVGQNWADLWPVESREMITTAVDAAQAGESIRCSGHCPTAKGAPKWWDVSVTPMRDDRGNVARILAISRDITLQRGTAERLRWSSEHDALTELPNRRAFETYLRAAILRAMKAGTAVALLLLDLDHFKHVNDTLGHDAGDHLLKVFARRLKESVRKTDFVSRLGGDEFAVIIEKGTKEEMSAASQTILSRLREPVSFGGRAISGSASIGGALFPQDASSANELFKNADIALYSLKDAGRGGTQMFQRQMREEAQLVSSQLSLARNALTAKTVEPHYQQKVELQSGQIVGFEALLRWRHGRRGLQHPDSVTEAFKDYELASKIGSLMQRRVFEDVRGWLDRGLQFGFVAINAAPAEFLRDDFAETLLSRMQELSIPPHLIEIEVTEHVFLERNSDYVPRALNLLASKGVRIALDDFGTGYSSLSHLRDYPVDVVKIDRSFVEQIASDQQIRAITCAVIDLAKSLDIEVVAEGIERSEQRRILIENGCAFGQGYLFGRAVEADEVLIALKGERRDRYAA